MNVNAPVNVNASSEKPFTFTGAFTFRENPFTGAGTFTVTGQRTV